MKCVECGNISITFDPYLTLPLPIKRSQTFEISFIPFELFKNEEDQHEHPVFQVPIDGRTTVHDIKEVVIERSMWRVGRKIREENLMMFTCGAAGQMLAFYPSDHLVQDVDLER